MKISVGTKLLEKLTYGLLFVMIVLMSTGTFFKFGGIPAFAFPWVLAFIGVFLFSKATRPSTDNPFFGNLAYVWALSICFCRS